MPFTMPIKSTLARIIASVAEEFMVPSASLDAQTTAAEVPGWDSISQVMLVMRLEDMFGKPLDPGILQAAPNLGALAIAIDAHP